MQNNKKAQLSILAVCCCSAVIICSILIFKVQNLSDRVDSADRQVQSLTIDIDKIAEKTDKIEQSSNLKEEPNESNTKDTNDLQKIVEEQQKKIFELDNSLYDLNCKINSLEYVMNGGKLIQAEKPVIYLYGYNNEEVSVKLNFDGNITCSYPEMINNSWTITAEPDGTLFSKGLQYSYLYWEGEFNDPSFEIKNGFCIKGSDTAAFLDKKLKDLGLNRKEAEDFITYWLPKMKDNTYNVISFQTKNYTSKAKLETYPEADIKIRVYMVWYPSETKIDLKEQYFAFPERKGRVLVEWGGSEISPVGNILNDTNNKKEKEYIITDEISEKELKNENLVDESLKQQQKIAEMLVQQETNEQNGHSYTDKNGNTAIFTNEEWQKLLNLCSYSNNLSEDAINFYTIEELRNILINN